MYGVGFLLTASETVCLEIVLTHYGNYFYCVRTFSHIQNGYDVEGWNFASAHHTNMERLIVRKFAVRKVLNDFADGHLNCLDDGLVGNLFVVAELAFLAVLACFACLLRLLQLCLLQTVQAFGPLKA